MDTIQGTWSRRNVEEYAQGIEAANDPELAAYGPDHLRATAQRLDDLGYTMYLHGYAAGLRIRAAEIEDEAAWCNHDRAAVFAGVCECGERVGELAPAHGDVDLPHGDLF